jgi:anti-sigma B factor antagonist
VTTGNGAERQALCFAEDMTVYNAATQKEQLVERLRNNADPGRVDLKQVAEIDTAGVQLLLVVRDAARAAGGTACLLDASPAVRETLRLLRLESSFEFANTP